MARGRRRRAQPRTECRMRRSVRAAAGSTFHRSTDLLAPHKTHQETIFTPTIHTAHGNFDRDLATWRRRASTAARSLARRRAAQGLCCRVTFLPPILMRAPPVFPTCGAALLPALRPHTTARWASSALRRAPRAARSLSVRRCRRWSLAGGQEERRCKSRESLGRRARR